MQFTKLGRSNMSVSRICLGTMHFGSYTSEEEAFRIMDKALEMGINFFDTANVYGGRGQQGTSEEIIGRWMKQGNRRDQIVLATKVYGNMTPARIPTKCTAFPVTKSVATPPIHFVVCKPTTSISIRFTTSTGRSASKNSGQPSGA